MGTVVDRNGETETVEVAGLREITFAISDRTLALLEELSRRSNKSVGEVLREAIALEKWYTDVRDENGRILVDRDGTMRELLSV